MVRILTSFLNPVIFLLLLVGLLNIAKSTVESMGSMCRKGLWGIPRAKKKIRPATVYSMCQKLAANQQTPRTAGVLAVLFSFGSFWCFS